MFGAKLLALSAFLAVAMARPSHYPRLDAIPSHAKAIAYDRDNNVLVAFDANGEHIGSFPASIGKRDMQKRQGGNCGLLSQDEATNLPGWSNITSAASSNWGSDYNLQVNPSDWPDMGANVCASGDPTQVTLDGTPACNTQNSTTGGTLSGTSGSVTLTETEGTTESTTLTVTQASMIGTTLTSSVTVKIPDIADVSTSLSAQVQYTNTVSNAVTFTTTDQQTQSVTMQAAAGQTCTLTFQSTTCSVTGTGSIQFSASGWIWFYYGSRRDGHYEWALQIESIITDVSQRSSYMQFSTQTDSTTNSQYSGSCA